MPRPNKIWYWKSRKEWCVKINGVRHRLGPDKKEAQKRFHQLMGQDEPQYIATDSVAVVLDAFITWCHENRAAKTTQRYQDFCQQFVDKHGRMKVAELNTGHVTSWLNEKDTWNSTTKHNAITALQRAFNWGVKNHGLRFNPIKGMEKPKPQRRTGIVTPEEFEEILSHYAEGDCFRDLITVSYDSGSRPQEIKLLEARHVDFEKQRAVIGADDGAKGGITRAIYFPTDRSMEIIRRLADAHPSGLMFRTTKGTPWNGANVRCRFQRLQPKVGKRFTHYMLRHTFVTRKLASGVDSHVVAKLAGHQNTAMLDKHYSHIADDYQFMLEQAKTGEHPPASKKRARQPTSRSRKKKAG